MDGDEGNIWTQEGERERKMVLWGIFWTKERGSERRMLLRVKFDPKRVEVGGLWCSWEYLYPRERK